MTIRGLMVGVLLIAGCGVAGAARPVESWKAGVATREFHPTEPIRNWRGDTAKSLRCVIWYPAAASAQEVRQAIGPANAPLFDAGMAAPNAEFAPAGKSGWPMVLLSHGSGGSALQMAWLGTALAHAGFIAVAVDHPGNNANAPMTPEGLALWWERATDISQTLDMMLADSEFGKKIDPSRVGAAGYSLGGYTVMELAGAQTDVREFFDLCRKKPDTTVCITPESRGLGSIEDVLKAARKTSGESLARSGELYSDDRIGAVFAIAPALGFTLTDESLGSIRLPVELVVGDADRTAPPYENAEWIQANIRGAKLTELPHVSHYTFLNVCTADGRKALERYCTDEKGIEREAVHEKVAGMAVIFFRKALRVK
jgi:predicted dienelactone hydrolase